MRRCMGGGPFYSATETAVTAAPTGTNGSECHVQTRGGDKLNSDEWTIGAVFTGGTNPYIDVVPYWKSVDGSWYPGTEYRLKGTPDSDGGATLDIPAPGAARRLYVRVTTWGDGGAANPTSVAIKAYHNEHDEGI